MCAHGSSAARGRGRRGTHRTGHCGTGRRPGGAGCGRRASVTRRRPYAAHYYGGAAARNQLSELAGGVEVVSEEVFTLRLKAAKALARAQEEERRLADQERR